MGFRAFEFALLMPSDEDDHGHDDAVLCLLNEVNESNRTWVRIDEGSEVCIITDNDDEQEVGELCELLEDKFAVKDTFRESTDKLGLDGLVKLTPQQRIELLKKQLESEGVDVKALLKPFNFPDEQ